MNIGNILISLAVAGILIFVQDRLCTKFKSPLWGGIIPFLFLGLTIFLFATEKLALERSNVIAFLLAGVIILLSWDRGRRKYKKLQQANLERMRAKDI